MHVLCGTEDTVQNASGGVEIRRLKMRKDGKRGVFNRLHGTRPGVQRWFPPTAGGDVAHSRRRIA